MSQIPTNIAASSLQAGSQANQVSKVREGAEDESARKSQQIKELAKAGEAVKVEEEDTAVFSDAEGQGSMGKESPDEEVIKEDAAAPDDAEETPLPAPGHIDLEA